MSNRATRAIFGAAWACALFALPPLTAQTLDLGAAADYAVLGLSGDGTVRATVIINSSQGLEGNLGIGAFATSSPNQKVDFFDGAARVHSTANFSYVPGTFNPSGGIHIGTSGGAIDMALDAASADALTASLQIAALAPTHNLGALGDNDNAVVVSSGPLNVIALASLNYKSDVLEFVSRPGFEDTFVVNVAGNFNFSQSEIRLTGTTPGHVLFNFLAANARVTIKKSATVFAGTLLAPSPTASIEYHNPATFAGAIIGYNINLHSDFRLRHVPFVPVNPGGGLGSIGDRVWNDLNIDRLQSSGEPGINGATVYLFDGALNLVGTQTTSGDGNYLFTDLPPDVYLVVVDPATLGLISPSRTFDYDGVDTEDEAQVVLGSGEDNLDVDFGYFAERN